MEQSLNIMAHSLRQHNVISFMDEVQNFWGMEWDIEKILEPTDKDELILCLKACIVERMSEVWNSPPKNCNTMVPGWCEKIAAYKPGWSVIPDNDMSFFKTGPVSKVFEKRNIFAPRDFMFFV